jgi:hypothetical protein
LAAAYEEPDCTGCGSLGMAKNTISIEIVQEGDERFILKTFANGKTTREPIVKTRRKKRYRSSILALGFE